MIYQYKVRAGFLLLGLVILLITNRALGQNNLSDTAFTNFKTGNYQLAAKLYKQLLVKENYKYPYPMEMLGSCSIRMDSIQAAKDILEKAMNTNYSLPEIQVHCCHDLADIYFKEGNYSKAKSLYYLYARMWEKARFDDVNKFAFKYHNAISISKCYENLKLIDSAVNVLTPYIFSTYLNISSKMFRFGQTKEDFQDSLKHDSVCVRYLSLLKRIHTNKSIKAELKKAEEGLSFIEKQRILPNDTTTIEKIAVCEINFYHILIPYTEFGVLLKK